MSLARLLALRARTSWTADPLRTTRACAADLRALGGLDDPWSWSAALTKVADFESRPRWRRSGTGRRRPSPRPGSSTRRPPRRSCRATSSWAPGAMADRVVVGRAGDGPGRRGDRGRRRRGRRPPTARARRGRPPPRVTPVSSIVGTDLVALDVRRYLRGRARRDGAAGSRRGRRRSTRTVPSSATSSGTPCATRCTGRGEVTVVCAAAGIDVEPLSGGYAGWLGRGCGSAWALRTACGLRTRVRSSSSLDRARGLVGQGGLALLVEHDDRRCAGSAAPARSPAGPGPARAPWPGGCPASLAIACPSSRSSETGTSARPVLGTGLDRIRGIRA